MQLNDTQAEMLTAQWGQEPGQFSLPDLPAWGDSAGVVDASAAPVSTDVSAGSSIDWVGFLKAIAQPAADITKTYFAAETAKAVAPYQYGAQRSPLAMPRYPSGAPVRYNAQGMAIPQTPGMLDSMMPVLLIGGAALAAYLIFSRG